MNEEVTVLTLDNGKQYVVLEKIKYNGQEYLILFNEENPRELLYGEYLNQEITEVTNPNLIKDLTGEFFLRHPEYQN